MNEFEERRHMRVIDAVFIAILFTATAALLNVSGLNLTEVATTAVNLAYIVFEHAK